MFISTNILFKPYSKTLLSPSFTMSLSGNLTQTNLLQENVFKGFELGIPMNIFTNIYTHLHYGYDITTIDLVVLQFLIGYFTYGRDRYNDALDFKQQPFPTDKTDLYELIYQNKELYQACFFLTFMEIFHIITTNQQLETVGPFILLLLTTIWYKQLKNYLGIFKSTYIALMWTMSVCILPCVLHDHDYSIFNYPVDYIPCALTLFASSNLADIKDIQEDKINEINTLPVVLGSEITQWCSTLAICLSGYLIAINQHFMDRPIINSLVEIQNIGIGLSPLISYFNSSI